MARMVQLQLDVANLRSALDEEREAASAADTQPSRVRHLADLAVNALRALREEEGEVLAQLRVLEAAEQGQLQVGGGHQWWLGHPRVGCCDGVRPPCCVLPWCCFA